MCGNAVGSAYNENRCVLYSHRALRFSREIYMARGIYKRNLGIGIGKESLL